MKPADLLWLAGAIWFGLGVAHDNLALSLFALAAWAGAAYHYRLDRKTNHRTAQRGANRKDNDHEQHR